MSVDQDAAVRRAKQLGPGIGKRLRQARESAGLTVRELAAAAHTSKKTVQAISDGEGGNSGVGLLWDLARACGVSPCWLAYGIEDEQTRRTATLGVNRG